MKSDGLLLVMKELKDKRNGEVYLHVIISDDDTKMKNYVAHPEYKQRGWKNYGEYLPSDIPVPNWFTDPTHRAKCVTGAYFDMTKRAKTDTSATKLNTL